MSQKYFLFLILIIVYLPLYSQKDSSQRIFITSSYKPSVPEPVKVQLNPTQLESGSTVQPLKYSIPEQMLNFSYVPVALKPIALNIDSSIYLGGRNFLKAGFGNYSTPFLLTGLSVGDGREMLGNVEAGYHSSKGKIENQDLSDFFARGRMSMFLPKNEFYLKTGFSRSTRYLYGYDHTTKDPARDDIRQAYQDIALGAGFRNTNVSNWKYDLSIDVNVFSFKQNLRENSLLLRFPVERKINENLSAFVHPMVDLTSFTTLNFDPNNIKFKNNVSQLKAGINFTGENIALTGGVSPTWDNGDLSILPALNAEIKLPGQPFSLVAGWTGDVRKNTFKNISTINPYLLPYVVQKNTTETEYFGGLKIGGNSGFSFTGKAGMVHYKNLALYKNNYLVKAGSGFDLVYEPTASNFRIQSSIAYKLQNKFEVSGDIILNGYTGLSQEGKAWHLPPLELKGDMKYRGIKNLLLTSGLYLFKGGKYNINATDFAALKGGADLDFGAEYSINKKIGVWLNVNNLLNNKYERWHNYPVYGTNVLGGVIVRF